MLSQKVCFECKREFNQDDLIEIKGSLICAACKPIVIQRVDEFGSTTENYITAGFGIRFAAIFLDGIFLMAVLFVLALIAGISSIFFKLPTEIVAIIILSYYIIFPLYYIYYIGKHGATIGKKIVKIKVIRMDGSPVGYGLAIGRFFAYILGFFTFYIGFIMAAFDKKYAQALHDKICNTRVIVVKK